MKEAHLQSPYPEQKEKTGLSIHNLSFLGNGPYSLDIEPGECVGLTGKSGIGKTQMLRAVADVIVHTGDCFLNGNSCMSVEPPEWRQTVAMVPAESFWWHDMVGDHFTEVDLQGEFGDLLKRLG
ncbi:MAG TPA: ATP-binding cassette domain-containing protein, partial [Desulfocapsa sulfexigens]|nr:ATP-binding cassette domain-containing protein [Desulfocapsa sulfexigens]